MAGSVHNDRISARQNDENCFKKKRTLPIVQPEGARWRSSAFALKMNLEVNVNERRIDRAIDSRRDMKAWALLLGLVLVAMLGCIPEGGGPGPGGGFSSVSGTVFDQSFSMYSGVAESTGGGYLITLTDSASYGCTSTPSGDYLRVIFEAGQVGTASASGNVTFSSVEANLDVSEGATAGSVSITEIDETFGTISGDLTASNASSSVSGTFTVDICP